MSTPRIYVACLASYNSGRLHGKWIDISTDKDAMAAEIRAMLRESPEPNVIRADYYCADCGEDRTITYSMGEPIPQRVECLECGEESAVIVGDPYRSAEEWAIHDYECMPAVFGEFVGLDTIAEYAELIEVAEDRGLDPADLARIVDHFGADYLDEAREAIEDRYHGHYDSLVAYAESYIEDSGMLDGVPETIARYFDYESLARDLQLGGDVLTVEARGGGVHVFSGA